jgi:hypothetical protein
LTRVSETGKSAQNNKEKVMSKKEVVAEDPTKNVPAVLDFGDDAELGYENQNNEDVSIPFLNILQGLSPQVTRS